MPVCYKERCVCQICTCGEHKCNIGFPSYYNINKSHHRRKRQIDFEEPRKTSTEIREEVVARGKQQEQLQHPRGRKQWEVNPESLENLKNSFSQLSEDREEQGQDSREAKEDYKSETLVLPPIKGSPAKECKDPNEGFIVENGLNHCEEEEEENKFYCKRSQSLQELRNFRHSIEEQEEVEEEEEEGGGQVDAQWIVEKPPRVKPRDQLQLEGKMDLETTFKSTIDSTAERRLKHRFSTGDFCENGFLLDQKGRRSRAPVTQTLAGVEIATVEPPPSFKRRHRPKTSLKIGGDGYFNTSNQEAYKKFVVKPSSTTNQTETSNKKSGKSGKAQSSSNARKSAATAATTTEVKDTENIKLPKVSQGVVKDNGKAPTDLFASKRRSALTNGNTSENHNVEDIQKSTDTQRISYRRSRPGAVRPISSLTVNGKFKNATGEESGTEETRVKRQAPKYQPNTESLFVDEPVEETVISHQVGDLGRNRTSRKSDKEEARTRHQSIPRRQHKNYSQLRFDGDMTFATTFNEFFNNTAEKLNTMDRSVLVEKTKSQERSKRRDLFRTSEDVCFNNVERFDGQTTYNCEFQDNLQCPAVLLDTDRSRYKYTNEVGGHRFYFPANKL